MTDQLSADRRNGTTERNLGIAFAIALVATLLLGLLESAQIAARTAGVKDPLSFGESVRLALPRWLLFAPLAIGSMAICERFPLDSRTWRRSLPIHFAAGLLFSLLHLASCVIIYGFLLDGAPNRFVARLLSLLTVYTVADLVIYSLIVGAWSAARQSRVSRQRELAAAHLTASLNEARLETLASQLQPHFLFNTLNATMTMAIKGDQTAVVQMLERLADLLRVSLDRNLPREIPLARELEILGCYLDIQGVRFGDRLRVTQRIDPQTLSALLPAMILQPLAENAIQHGIAARPGPGEIRIVANRKGDELLVEIHDTGPGFSRNGSEAGIGIGNTQARLEHSYGSAARVRFGTSEGGGALVTMTLPFQAESGLR